MRAVIYAWYSLKNTFVKLVIALCFTLFDLKKELI